MVFKMCGKQELDDVSKENPSCDAAMFVFLWKGRIQTQKYFIRAQREIQLS